MTIKPPNLIGCQYPFNISMFILSLFSNVISCNLESLRQESTKYYLPGNCAKISLITNVNIHVITDTKENKY